MAFDVIFADPPFTKQMADEVMTLMSQSPLFGKNTIMAIESARREKLEPQYGNLIRSDQRIFGDKILSFFTKSLDQSETNVNV
jgi:16S rRNA G966 N2-methylase RsmD